MEHQTTLLETPKEIFLPETKSDITEQKIIEIESLIGLIIRLINTNLNDILNVDSSTYIESIEDPQKKVNEKARIEAEHQSRDEFTTRIHKLRDELVLPDNFETFNTTIDCLEKTVTSIEIYAVRFKTHLASLRNLLNTENVET
jgi:hypothetical protein